MRFVVDAVLPRSRQCGILESIAARMILPNFMMGRRGRGGGRRADGCGADPRRGAWPWDSERVRRRGAVWFRNPSGRRRDQRMTIDVTRDA